MENVRGEFVGELSAVANVENNLAISLTETAGEVARTECFDNEQRAEVYAILDAMKSDSEAHRQVLGCWVSDRTVEQQDA